MGANWVDGKFVLTGMDTIYEGLLHPKQCDLSHSAVIGRIVKVGIVLAVVGTVLGYLLG